MKNLKNILLITLALFLATSCIQQEDIEKPETVEIIVDCEYCIAYFMDGVYHEKHFVVIGSFTYEFLPRSLQSVYIRVERSALVSDMPLYAAIKFKGKNLVVHDGPLGWEGITIEAPLK